MDVGAKLLVAGTGLLRIVVSSLSGLILLPRWLLLPVQVPNQPGVGGAMLAWLAAGACLEGCSRMAVKVAEAELLLIGGTRLAHLAVGTVLEGTNILVSTLGLPSCLMDIARHRRSLLVSLANKPSFVFLPGRGTCSSGLVRSYVGLVFLLRGCHCVVDT